jgi:hypothetical protein
MYSPAEATGPAGWATSGSAGVGWGLQRVLMPAPGASSTLIMLPLTLLHEPSRTFRVVPKLNISIVLRCSKESGHELLRHQAGLLRALLLRWCSCAQSQGAVHTKQVADRAYADVRQVSTHSSHAAATKVRLREKARAEEQVAASWFTDTARAHHNRQQISSSYHNMPSRQR